MLKINISGTARSRAAIANMLSSLARILDESFGDDSNPFARGVIVPDAGELEICVVDDSDEHLSKIFDKTFGGDCD